MLTSINKFLNSLTDSKIILIIVFLGFVVFANGLFNGFVADDLPLIVMNPKSHSIVNLSDFFRGSIYFDSSDAPLQGLYYKPLLLTTISLSNTIFGVHALPLHVLQISIHILNSALVFYLFKHFFDKRLAIFLSMIFLVHPINSESVFYIAAIQENLFFSFGISALLILVYKMRGYYLTVLAPFLLLLSLLSKETGGLFFIMIITYILLFEKTEKVKKLIIYVVPILIYLLMRFMAVGVLTAHSQASPIAYSSFTERMLNVPSLISFYLIKFIYPKDLVMSYTEVIKYINLYNFYAPLILIILFISVFLCLGIYFWIKKPNKKYIYLFFSLWIIFGILLHIQIIPLDMSASERWMYFPIVGFLGLIGLVGSSVKIKSDIVKKGIFVFAIFILILLSIRTFYRSFDWRDNYTLAKHDLRINPNDYLLNGNLGYELYQRGDRLGAQTHLEKSVKIYPKAINNYNNLCTVYFTNGIDNNNNDLKEKGISCYIDMSKSFDSPYIYTRLIKILLIEEDKQRAIEYLNEGLIRYPTNKELLSYRDQLLN